MPPQAYGQKWIQEGYAWNEKDTCKQPVYGFSHLKSSTIASKKEVPETNICTYIQYF